MRREGQEAAPLKDSHAPISQAAPCGLETPLASREKFNVTGPFGLSGVVKFANVAPELIGGVPAVDLSCTLFAV